MATAAVVSAATGDVLFVLSGIQASASSAQMEAASSGRARSTSSSPTSQNSRERLSAHPAAWAQIA
jgi:hypothetical protein